MSSTNSYSIFGLGGFVLSNGLIFLNSLMFILYFFFIYLAIGKPRNSSFMTYSGSYPLNAFKFAL